MPVGNVPGQIRLVSWAPVLLLAAFPTAGHSNDLKVDAALPLAFSNTPAQCEADQMDVVGEI